MEISARLDLPGEGDVGVCCNGDSTALLLALSNPLADPDSVSYLVHATPNSLTSYPILFPSAIPSVPPSRAPTPHGTPHHRAVSSAVPSPILRTAATVPSDQGLRKTRSVTSIRDAAAEPVHPKAEKGFAKFLAARRADWGGKSHMKGNMSGDAQLGIGEGVEVERDGYGAWKTIKLKENGDGVGLAEGCVDVSCLRHPYTGH